MLASPVCLCSGLASALAYEIAVIAFSGLLPPPLLTVCPILSEQIFYVMTEWKTSGGRLLRMS